VKLTPDNLYVVSSSYDNSIKFWDVETKKLSHELTNPHSEGVSCFIVSSNNRFMASASKDGSIKIFDMDSGKE